jgi:protein phosphatase
MPRFAPTAYAISDIGLVRKTNQDSYLILPEIPLFAIADGMGGHKAGEVASKQILTSLEQHFSHFSPQHWADSNYRAAAYFLQQGIEYGNRHIHQLGKREEYHHMGSTLCCLMGFHEQVVYAHVGDSRIYALRSNKLHLLTEDHSLIEEITTYTDPPSHDHSASTCHEESSIEQVHYKHVLTRAIGIHERIKPSFGAKRIRSGDLYLLCSDGLSDCVPFTLIERTLVTYYDSLEKAAEVLIYLAKHYGGRDNISALLIRWNQTHQNDSVPIQSNLPNMDITKSINKMPFEC